MCDGEDVHCYVVSGQCTARDVEMDSLVVVLVDGPELLPRIDTLQLLVFFGFITEASANLLERSARRHVGIIRATSVVHGSIDSAIQLEVRT